MSLDLITIEPEWIVAAFALAVILLDLFVKEKKLLTVVSLFGLVIAAIYAVIFSVDLNGEHTFAFNQMLVVDNFAIFFKLLFLGTAFLVILASNDYVKKLGESRANITL